MTRADRAEARLITEIGAESLTPAEVVRFRESVADPRFYACWLLSCYGMRRSEVLGLRWSAVDLDIGALSIRRGRVAAGTRLSRVDRSLSAADATCCYRRT